MDEFVNFIDDITHRLRDRTAFLIEVDRLVMTNNIKGYLMFKVKNRLYNYGTDADGKLLEAKDTPLKSQQDYRKRKRKQGYRAHVVTLRREGDFYKSFEITSKKGEIQIIPKSSDELTNKKNDTLLEKYGDQAIQITTEDATYVLGEIADDLWDWVLGKDITLNLW